MGIDSVIGCADHVLGNGISKENRHDAVRLGVSVVLVEGDQDQCAFHEVGVLKERSQPALEELAGDGDGAVAVSYTHLTLPTKRIV